MAIGYFIVPYVRRAGARPLREVSLNALTDTILAEGGAWSEVEVLGNQAVVKVRASAGVLTQINGLAGVSRIPLAQIDDSLSSLTAGQRSAIVTILTDAGYTVGEVTARFPNVAQATLRDVLKFLASRRRKPRYDVGTDTIVVDGAVQGCGSIDALELTVF